MSTPDFVKGASGPQQVYDTSPAGLGLSPAYLAAGATASATAGGGSVSGSIPASPVEAQQWIYQDLADGIRWQFVYYATDGYWYFIGGSPFFTVDTSGTNRQNTSDATWQALTGVAAFTAPFSGVYRATYGCGWIDVTNTSDLQAIGLSLNGASPGQPFLHRLVASDAGVSDDSPAGSVLGEYTLTSAQTLAVQIYASTHANSYVIGGFLSVAPLKVH